MQTKDPSNYLFCNPMSPWQETNQPQLLLVSRKAGGDAGQHWGCDDWFTCPRFISMLNNEGMLLPNTIKTMEIWKRQWKHGTPWGKKRKLLSPITKRKITPDKIKGFINWTHSKNAIKWTNHLQSMKLQCLAGGGKEDVMGRGRTWSGRL